MDPQKRITGEMALNSSYFDDLREMDQNPLVLKNNVQEKYQNINIKTYLFIGCKVLLLRIKFNRNSFIKHSIIKIKNNKIPIKHNNNK